MKSYQEDVEFLGQKIEKGLIKVREHAIEFESKFLNIIKDKRKLQRFFGCLNYISTYYKDCASDRRVLNQKLKKDLGPWTIEHT